MITKAFGFFDKYLKRPLLIGMLIIIICIPFLIYFEVDTGAKRALREAKNVNITLKLLDIEKYGKMSSVYNPKSYNGLSKGVLDDVNEIIGHQCDIELKDYDIATRRVLRMRYRYKNYVVEYIYDNEEDNWSIYYMLKIKK